jgi:hypothetical protein
LKWGIIDNFELYESISNWDGQVYLNIWNTFSTSLIQFNTNQLDSIYAKYIFYEHAQHPYFSEIFFPIPYSWFWILKWSEHFMELDNAFQKCQETECQRAIMWYLLNLRFHFQFSDLVVSLVYSTYFFLSCSFKIYKRKKTYGRDPLVFKMSRSPLTQPKKVRMSLNSVCKMSIYSV